jgi:para-aminobenzoate synthetase/4-amino-4-deoxychorismate lyase
VFETLLVLDGRPVDLDAHLARLESSLTALFPHHPLPPLDVPQVRYPYGHEIEGTSEGRSAEALRVVVAPDESGRLEMKAERREAKPAGRVALVSHVVSGGLGRHKWADRSLLEEMEAGLPDDALPLLVDTDGAVLEASRANLFAVRDGALFTPPLDGRILPGITRRRVIERARAAAVTVHERALSHEDLLRADEVFLTGSVRGIERAASLDDAPLTSAEAAAAFG